MSEYKKDREVIAAATASTDSCPECSARADDVAKRDRDMCYASGGDVTFGVWVDSYESAVKIHGCGRTTDVIDAARQARAERDARARWPAALDEIERLREGIRWVIELGDDGSPGQAMDDLRALLEGDDE